MKKNVRRWLALCLALALVFSLFVVASAATKTFTYGGMSYTASLTKTSGSKTVKYILIGSNQVQHISGGVDTPMYGPGVDFTYRLDAQNLPSGTFYASYVTSLLSQEGLRTSYTASWDGDVWHHVEPDKPSGTYRWAVKIYYYDTSWEVRTDNQILYGGTINKAPEGIWAYDAVLM